MSINPTGGQHNDTFGKEVNSSQKGIHSSQKGDIGGRKVSYGEDSTALGGVSRKTSEVASSIQSDLRRHHHSTTGRSIRNLFQRIINWFRGKTSQTRSAGNIFSPQGSLNQSALVKGLKSIAQDAENMKTNSKRIRELWEKLETHNPVEYKLMGMKILLETLTEKQESISRNARGFSNQGKLLKDLKSSVKNLLGEAVYEGNETNNWDKANIFFLFLFQITDGNQSPAEVMDELNENHDPTLTQIGVDMEKLKSKGNKDYSKGLQLLVKEGCDMLNNERDRMMNTSSRVDYRLVGRSVGQTKFLLKEIGKTYSGVSQNAILILANDMFPSGD